MFDNIGGKIKNLAVAICVFGMIASLVFAIVLWSHHDEYEYATRTYSNTIGVGIAVLVGGAIGSWVGSFFMYGFGELIEETTRNRQINEEILRALIKRNSEPNAEKKGNDVPVAFSNNTSTRSLSQVAPLRAGVGSSGWTCKKCGTRNGNYDISCKDCGNYK